ncbi:DUF1003 domain-containing protein [Sphingomonas sp. M1-B02]|uniref:DUF1003 domain-containing protein n=1 Tax=Sphingomonas sp. M1-B02 TaxID=3114300 RepID=UPI00223F2590|nr:DUF1003 domain-containing protein [Sphingomonas sp. S6-11]UZK66319.1 DUF1003 domain-containing protein [Sphingomonas sp. S6-11]
MRHGTSERLPTHGARHPSVPHLGDAADEAATRGDRLADRVAAVGGSWGFIIAFSVVLLGWMLLNTDVLQHWGLAFDPYPYIFLNLMLSTLAAVQAPVIMMSQNRQSKRDRVAASLDYEVNLRCELEMLRLHEKVDVAVARRLDEILMLLRRDFPAESQEG